MTTTPTYSWSSRAPVPTTDDDPWDAWPDASTKWMFDPDDNHDIVGTNVGVEHLRLGDEEFVDPFGDGQKRGEQRAFWDVGYYSSPVNTKDR